MFQALNPIEPRQTWMLRALTCLISVNSRELSAYLRMERNYFTCVVELVQPPLGYGAILASFPAPPSFPSLAVRKSGRGPGTFPHVSDVMDRANYANVGDMQKNLARTYALEHDYSESKDGSAPRHFYVALHETVGRTESFTKPRQ